MKALGFLLILAGIALGLYLGLWVFFVGGIVGLVHAVLSLIHGSGGAGLLAWSIVKILFAGFVGYLSAALLVIPGGALIVGSR